jgi:hypothetical protein
MKQQCSFIRAECDTDTAIALLETEENIQV